jgi:hypothetical protein
MTVESYGSSSTSKTNLAGSTSRSSLSAANEPDRTKPVQKKEVFPTTATGADPTPPLIETSSRSADYYRYGKFVPGDVPRYEIEPLEFKPIDDEMKTASIRVWGQRPSDNRAVDIIPPYSKFFLESVQESHTERSQIVETFGDYYVFMFGERPPVYNFAGQLVNSRFTNWVTDFMFLYDRYMRGTRCVENNAVVVMTYGNRQIEGLMLNTANNTTATIEGAVPFSFSMVVFERKFIHFSEDMGYSTADNTNLIQDEAFARLLEQVAGPEGKEQSREEVNLAIQAARGTIMAGEPSNSIFDGGLSVA